LALIGYGTQFCADELDEGDRIVDSPAVPAGSAEHYHELQPTEMRGLKEESSGIEIPEIVTTESTNQDHLRSFMVKFGKKYLGKRLRDIPKREIEGYVSWLENQARSKKLGLTPEVKLLKDAVERFHHPDRFEARHS